MRDGQAGCSSAVQPLLLLRQDLAARFELRKPESAEAEMGTVSEIGSSKRSRWWDAWRGGRESTCQRVIQMRAAAARLQGPQFPLLPVLGRSIALSSQGVHQMDLQPEGGLQTLHLRGVARVSFCVGAWEDPRILPGNMT